MIVYTYTCKLEADIHVQLSFSFSVCLSLCLSVCLSLSLSLSLSARYEGQLDDVIVTYRRFPLMNLFLTLNQSEEIIFFHDTSKIGDFTAFFGRDRFSNRCTRPHVRARIACEMHVV